MNENLAQLLEDAEEESLKYFRKGGSINVEKDLQTIKTSIELFGKMLDALNEGLKNGDKISKLAYLMEFYLRQMIYGEFNSILEIIEDGEVEKIKTY